MTRTLRVRQLVGAFLWLALVLAVCARWIGAQQPSTPSAEDLRFTGKTSAMEATGLGVSRRRFEAGARSAWHSHDRGQLLFVEEGRARVQKRGQPLREMGPGESDYTRPNVVHWHGAAPGQPFVQVAVGFGGETKWREKVTDKEYLGKAR